MYSLLITVLSIVLLAIVVAGGSFYLSTNRGSTTETRLRVATTYNSVEMAFGAYRVSNGGALPDLPSLSDDPQSSSLAWRRQIAPYLAGALIGPYNTGWSYGLAGGRRYVCVSTVPGAVASEALIAGLRGAMVDSSAQSVLAPACGATTSSGVGGGSAALTFTLQAGG